MTEPRPDDEKHEGGVEELLELFNAEDTVDDPGHAAVRGRRTTALRPTPPRRELDSTQPSRLASGSDSLRSDNPSSARHGAARRRRLASGSDSLRSDNPSSARHGAVTAAPLTRHLPDLSDRGPERAPVVLTSAYDATPLSSTRLNILRLGRRRTAAHMSRIRRRTCTAAPSTRSSSPNVAIDLRSPPFAPSHDNPRSHGASPPRRPHGTARPPHAPPRPPSGCKVNYSRGNPRYTAPICVRSRRGGAADHEPHPQFAELDGGSRDVGQPEELRPTVGTCVVAARRPPRTARRPARTCASSPRRSRRCRARSSTPSSSVRRIRRKSQSVSRTGSRNIMLHHVVVRATDHLAVPRVAAPHLPTLHDVACRPGRRRHAATTSDGVVLGVAVGVEDPVLLGGGEPGDQRTAVATVDLVATMRSSGTSSVSASSTATDPSPIRRRRR